MDKLYKIQTKISYVITDIVVRAKSEEDAMAYATSTDEWVNEQAFDNYLSDAPLDDNGKKVYSITPVKAVEIATPHDMPFQWPGEALPWGEDSYEELCVAEIFYGIQDPYAAGELDDEEDYEEKVVEEAWDKYHDEKAEAIKKFNEELRVL
jgi:hypothetical protein